LADLREIEVRKRWRELLEADAVSRDWSDMMRRVRAGVLAVTSRLRQQMPHLTPHDIQLVDRELRNALTGLADDVEEASSPA
jgi:terminase small subunit / prophage DNA-packing protein